MKSSYLKNTRLKGGWVKYFIFNVILFGAFFALQGNAVNIKAASPSDFGFVINNSNYKGNNASNSYAAYVGERWYTAGNEKITSYTVQGRGVAKKDVVSMTITKTYTSEIRSIAVFESGYTTSGNRNYDVYRKSDSNDAWTSLTELKVGSSTEYEIQPGLVVTPTGTSCGVFDHTKSLDASLAANSASGTYYSMFCITDDTSTKTLTIQYVYTIREGGYGFKEVYFAFYNDVPSAAPAVAEAESVMFVLSKPISGMEFTWLDEASEECSATTTKDLNSTSSPDTEKICAKYVNGTPTTQDRALEISIPKEITYVHEVSNTRNISDIEAQSIYGINTFQNTGSGGDVRYYYYDFVLYDGNDYDDAGNEKLDPLVNYYIYIMIDAKGDYILYMKDVFDNTYTSTVAVEVTDVSKTDIIVDYTNEANLTIMEAAGAYTDGDWKKSWTFNSNTSNTINLTKLQKDEVNIVIHIFQKIAIDNGVHDNSAGSEEIAKDPLGYSATALTGVNYYTSGTINVWRVTDLANDNNESSKGVTCGNNTDVLCGATSTFAYTDSDADSGKEGYGVDGVKNRIEFTVKSNGIYRIQVTDNYGNTTDGARGGTEKNPSVQVSVIDRTTPVISSYLAGASTSIETYPYVIGGGEKQVTVPNDLTGEYWNKEPMSETYGAIYYNSKGSKRFDYADALQIAQIYVVDNVLYYDATKADQFNEIHAGSQVHFNKACNSTPCAGGGVYVNNIDGLKSNTDASSSNIHYPSTSLSVHEYIINNNITSFSGGLVERVSATSYSANDYSATMTGGNDAFVNSTGNFLGYLQITFQDASGSLACTVSTSSEADNQSCFNLMNRYIDDVENFKMIFEATDYNGHVSSTFTVSVEVIDTTAPGIDMAGYDEDGDPLEVIEYTNRNTDCVLEIGNDIQSKTSLLTCYKLLSGTTYKIKDNNVNHEDSDPDELGDGKQFYVESGVNNYHSKIVMEIYGEWADGTSGYREIKDDAFPHLDKSGYHKFKFTINDHWDPLNVLTIYVTYYVNPRTLLVEPLANEKMYGEADPTSTSNDHDSTYQFDFCVYINNNKYTFNLEDYYFETQFINTYFTNIYCSKDVFVNTVDGNGNHIQKYKATEVNNDASHPYTYNRFDANNSGTYIKVNNTYISLSGATYYRLVYTANTTGNYYKDASGNYHEIKSGYTYKDEQCLYLDDGTSTDKYLKLGIGSGNCKKIESASRYVKEYKADGSGVEYTYIKYNTGVDPYFEQNITSNNNSGKLIAALIDGYKTDGFQDVFTGGLTRVESASYNLNRYGASYTGVINNNVGLYNIVLGDLSVTNSEIPNKDKDYLIRMNTNYRAGSRTGTDPLKYASGDPQDDSELDMDDDDNFKTESTVQFMIRQALLTVKATGSSKVYGAQDPYSNVWNTLQTTVNEASTGYLKGYTVTGYRNGDGTGKEIILGVLRRNTGENVGKYDICNVYGSPMNISGCSSVSSLDEPVYYNSTTEYYYATYGHNSRYKFADFDNENSGDLLNDTYGFGLITRKNEELIAASDGIRLNRTTRNYAILYIPGNFEIQQSKIIVQPGVNQGKEYAYNEYNDPLWQLVVYGESTITASASATSFNGYTQTIAADTFEAASISNPPYSSTVGDYTPDTEVYYARRKTSPALVCTDTTSYSDCYKYVLEITLADYVKFEKDANGYYKENATGQYVFAYGMYRSIAGASGGKLKITIVGNLVNETYSLFTTGFKITRETGEDVGWYTYDGFKDNGADAKDQNNVYVINKNNNQTCGAGAEDCRNYLVTFTDRAPEATMDGDVIKAYTTDVTIAEKEYKPDGVHGCNSSSEYSKACDAGDKNKITFEIFKREIIVEFIDENYTFIYGSRYETYQTILEDSMSGKERNIFLCYSDLGDYLVDCTGDGDYGITEGDSWENIGLKFYLHTSISAFIRNADDTIQRDSTKLKYYASGTGAENIAIPAGEYYVYASISNAALENYKFTYKGGTLRIAPKVTNVQLTGYTMEYADPHYSSYGLGTNYTSYTVTSATCMLDEYYTNEAGLAVNAANYGLLIENCTGENYKKNEVGNTYGFVIEGLDAKDTIKNNFKGRPQRAANTSGNKGNYVDVGFYKINVGSISTIKDLQVTLNDASGGNVCATDPKGNASSTCVYKTNAANAINYDITYSLNNNEGAYLFVLPANLDVTVEESQAKMYGCAYYTEHYLNDYKYGYTYTDGYTNCDGTYDSAYKFHVAGDKDNATTHGQSINYDVTTSAYAAATGHTYAVSGVSGSGSYATKIFEGNLFRVSYSAGIDYSGAKASATANKYQGQTVGIYTVSLGDFDAINNANAAMCDAYNNPVLNGGQQCKNYNINYYGENASNATSNATHNYVDKKDSIDLDNLKLYSLNYTSSTAGNYLKVNGNYLDISRLQGYSAPGTAVSGISNYVLVSTYVKIGGTTLPRYKKLPQYTAIANGDSTSFIYLDGEYKQISTLSSIISGDYITINGNNIRLASVTKFVKNTVSYQADSNGAYVFINGEYVELSSLKKYAYDSTTGLYQPSAGGEYVQIYEYIDISSGANRFNLSVTDTGMYATEATLGTTNNLFVFVNGSFVPYSSVSATNIYDAEFVTAVADTYTEDVEFVISARIVYLHPEYNAKPYGENDIPEKITCDQIKQAYGLTNFDGRSDSYCGTSTDITLGTSMYYAVQNSLAKHPWTAWTDTGDGTAAHVRSSFNDLQYDVVKGQVKRAQGAQGDVAGKYSYDFIDVTTNDDLNGKNYLIYYVVEGNEAEDNNGNRLKNPYDYENTYVQTEDSFSDLESLLSVACDADVYEHCFVGPSGEKKTIKSYTLKVDANGYVIADQTQTGAGIESKSISLIDKYSSTSLTNKVDYWYLGFYNNDLAEGRVGEITKWWSESESSIFTKPYDTFKVGVSTTNRTNKAYVCSDTSDEDTCVLFPYSTESGIDARQVYFEIIKRTIYLYAVDTQKTYGEADKYSDFKVAICPNNEGYIVDASGIKCQSEAQDRGYGLSEDDKDEFATGGVMQQERIKNKGQPADYIFNGTPHLTDSFGIYFRRAPGEEAGMYTITACAIQTGVSDCTQQAPNTQPNYQINYLGDNYDIIEISGVLTINTRQLHITPDANQGFQYGNYTEDGSMPSITFTEKEYGQTHGGLVNSGSMYLVEDGNYTPITRNGSLYTFRLGGTDYTIDGLSVIKADGTLAGTIVVSTNASTRNSKTVVLNSKTYNIIQTARCLINISGLSTVCINDAQNEALNMDVTTTSVTDTVNGTTITYNDALDVNLQDKLFSFGASYAPAVITKSALGNVTYVTNDVYGDAYANPANRYSRKETTAGDRNALTLQCGTAATSNYSRDVCEYKIRKGGLEIDEEFNQYSKTIYVYASHSRLYKFNGSDYTKFTDAEYTAFVNSPTTQGTIYIEYGGQYIEYDTSTDGLVSYICTAAGTCNYMKNTTAGAVNRYLAVNVADYNYIIKAVDDEGANEVSFEITQALITVTPQDRQYKIYGETDVEIKFDVQTKYVVGRTQYQNFDNSNIVTICNGASCVSGSSLNDYRYSASYAKDSNGALILLIKGWEVYLDSFAYDEETNETNLDYGESRKSDEKYKSTSTVETTQSPGAAVHFDKFTKYSNSVTTKRILIGNLYVTGHDQTVGEKVIINGMIVANNKNGNKNYDMQALPTVKFVIVPRPINVQIKNVTKIYGQATDNSSCDSSVGNCLVGDGILTASENNNLLINNFEIINNALTTEVIVGGTGSSGTITKTIETASYTSSNGGGVQVQYSSNTLNLPNDTYATAKANTPNLLITNLTEADVDSGYNENTAYYTAAIGAETKNDSLNIEVQRENVNVARNAKVADSGEYCMVAVSGETFCEDAGEYYLKFATRQTTNGGDVTLAADTTVPNAYYGRYWGYNPNYYVVVYNNFEAGQWATNDGGSELGDSTSSDVTLNTTIDETGANGKVSESATLKIRKRSIQMVVETIDTYTYSQNNSGTHLKVEGVEDTYYLIMKTNRYTEIATGVYQQHNDGEYLYTGSTYVKIENSARYNLSALSVGEKYVIEQNMDVPELLVPKDEENKHHTSYGAITWYEHPLQVRINDKLYGKVAYCQHRNVITGGLDDLRDDGCDTAKLRYYDVDVQGPSGNTADGKYDINQEGTNNFFNTEENGHYIITREKSVLYIGNGTGITNGNYEANNYVTDFLNGIFQIDLDETAPVINVEKDFVSKEANNGNTNDDDYASHPLTFLDTAADQPGTLKNNYCEGISTNRGTDANKTLVKCQKGGTTVQFTFTDDSLNTTDPTIEYAHINTLVQMFGISSYDPSIMRVGQPVQKRYHEKFYMAIQKDFNQKKTGDYSLFIYAQDDAGNISLATVVTLRIVDETNPSVGTMNLYSAKVKCKTGSNCALESSWVVAEDVYLPISTLTSDNIDAIRTYNSSILTKKYSRKAYASASDANLIVEDNIYGTYYKIPANTPATAVKHSGWTNTSTGIYMTVTYDATSEYGEDNSLTYLDISGYTKYNADSTTITENLAGEHILLGSFVNIANLTKYKRLCIDDSTDNQKACGSGDDVVYIPDKLGTLIKYKGYYYDLVNRTYYNLDGSSASSVDEAHTAHIYKRTGTEGSYQYTVHSGAIEIDDTATYVIRDGNVYELPAYDASKVNRYTADGVHSSTGTYINFAQWDHYFTLDGGYTWSKFSRDSVEGQLVLGQDGQRLVMIKAVDTGFMYQDKTVDKVHVSEAYCEDIGEGGSCNVWHKVGYATDDFTDQNGTKVEKYNISVWDNYAEGGSRDRQYAYLDTILPSTKLTDKYIEIYEYGCISADKCKTNHTELFGTSNDGYYFELSRLNRYNKIDTNNYELNPNGDYVYFNGAYIDTTERKTTINSKVYVYLGKTDSLQTIDTLITEKIGNRIHSELAGSNFIKNLLTGAVVKDNDTNDKSSSIIKSAVYNASEANRKQELQANTTYKQSGVGLGTSMKDDGYDGNKEKTFGATIVRDPTSGDLTISAAGIAEKYVQINIYAHVEGSGGITGHSFLTKGAGYYKFIIQNHPTTGGLYQVLACYSGATAKNEGEWCTNSSDTYEVNNATYTSIKAVMEDLLAVYKDNSGANAINFNGNDVTYTVDYRVFDTAGNASEYVRKVMLLTSFTTTISVNSGGAAAAAASVEVPQNANLSQVLSSYNIGAADGDGLKSGERILQTVYYNDQLVSSREEYDINALANLDTTVPGVYRIVYSVQRRDGMQYVEGNSVELYVTVKPTVANVEKFAIDYKAAFISLAGLITIGLTFAYINLKKKQEN